MDRDIELLLSTLRTDDPPVDPDVLKRVVAELCRQDKATVATALIEGLRDVDPEYRGTIASVFLATDFETAMQHVPALLHDEDGGIQGFVCVEIAKYGRRGAVPHLLEVLQSDPEGTHRLFAARGLGHIGDPAALPALTKAMQNDDGVDYEGRPVKKTAAEAIRQITQEKATASVA